MRVALVWPTAGSKWLDRGTRRDLQSVAADHVVDVWVHPSAVSRTRRQLANAHAVEPLPHAKVAELLATTDADLVIVADSATARKALTHLPEQTPLVYWVQSGMLARARTAVRRTPDALPDFASDLDSVLCSSPAVRADLLASLGPGKVPVFSTVLGTEALGESGDSGPSTGVGKPHLVGSGALVSAAGFGDVVRGFDTSGVASQDWRLTLFGSGPHADPLNKLAQWRGVGDAVTFAPATALEQSLDSSAILITPGTAPSNEDFVIETAARGIPVIGFEGDPAASLIAEAGGGVLVPPGAHRALGAALRHLAHDADALAGMRARAREAAGELAGAVSWIQALEVLSERPARRHVAGPSHNEPRNRDEHHDHVELVERIGRALSSAGIEHARVAETSGDDAFVAGAEDVTRAVDALLTQGACHLVLYVGDHPAHAAPVRSSEEVPVFVAFTNRIDVVDEVSGQAASIDFWSAGADGVRCAPRSNAEAEWVGARSWRAWLESSAGSVTGLPLWDQVDFPVDAVFTWVDDADPDWQARRDRHLPDRGLTPQSAASDGAADDRFINRDEIYYSVAAARRHLPWLRRMIVVADGQRHTRIQADFPEVEFVDHREIFPDADALPVFNSHAIEACLHRIPGLAEHFLYFNDDMLVTAPLRVTEFFDANGVARFFPSSLKVNFDDEGSGEPHLLAGAGNRKLIARDFGIEITRSMLHTPYPHLRSVLEEMELRYPDEFDRTRRSRFRDGADISVMSSFAQHYGWATRRYRPGSLEYRFVRLHSHDLETRMRRILEDASVQVVCMGEPLPDQSRHEHEARLVREFMEELAG